MTKLRAINDPVGCWWAAFDDGSVWPVEVLSANMFGVRVRATHESAPEGEHVFHTSRVYDSKFNHVKWGSKRTYVYEDDETTGLAGHPDGNGERW